MKRIVLSVALLAFAGCASQVGAPIESLSLPLSTTAVSQVSVGDAEPRAYSAMVIDVKSGRVLHEENATAPRYPASLSKMMTLFLLFEEIRAGRLSMNAPLSVSAYAAAQPPSKIGLRAGSTISVADAMRALCVKSANDVAVVLAENIAGSQEEFARRMTAMARALGMNQTRFVNASGLPDSRQVTTARDMAILGRALKLRHPAYSRYFAQREFRYGGRTFKATNKLLGKVRGVDGIKTGYIRLSGYNLVASASRGGRHVIVVVIGGKSGRDRDQRVATFVDRYL